jgi:HSP20 family protein
VEGNSLTLTAERKNEREEKGDGGYIRRERSYGAYQRSFNISNIASDKIEAEYVNGILSVTLPKKVPEAPKNKSIEIK